ncbi:hypothetical protein MRB53_028524 [Persea americana]|uniref:Uncharacterized protein n=1 Tax=Persea americana TaxID=3435 RepID=A0ACC2KFQ6_PERAE|nr:hypothetical protein MRB53_028524 [Persea americana]
MEILESHEKPNVFAHNALISGRDGLGGGNELHGFGDFLGVLDRVDAFAELAEACVDGGRGGAGVFKPSLAAQIRFDGDILK